ncbi:MAG: flagellar biosynthetic protein FliR [Lachnospiraceae bacterium]|nr:flagellar biosynthetic protein FliR [Lachnospiraceae bacterium]
MIHYTFTYDDLIFFLLIFVRISCCVFVVPFFSMNTVPMRLRAGLSFFISLLMYYVLSPHAAIPYHTVLGYSALVLKEAVTGFLIGFGVNLCTSILGFAGHVVDMEVGLSMATLYDPATRESVTLTGMFYQYTIMLMLIISGMYEYIIKALAETFTLIPITGAIFRSDHMVTSLIMFMTDYITIGLRICLPVFVVIMILDAVLGIMAKVSPQLNMFAVGIQLKLLVGLAVLFLTAAMLPKASEMVFVEIRRMVVSFVEGMM